MSDNQTPMPAAVERWDSSGGTWQVEVLAAGLVRILLCRCDGGEVVDVMETADPVTVRWALEQSD